MMTTRRSVVLGGSGLLAATTLPFPRPAIAHLISMLADRLPTRAPSAETELVASETPSPMREAAPAQRAEVRRDLAPETGTGTENE